MRRHRVALATLVEVPLQQSQLALDLLVGVLIIVIITVVIGVFIVFFAVFLFLYFRNLRRLRILRNPFGGFSRLHTLRIFLAGLITGYRVRSGGRYFDRIADGFGSQFCWCGNWRHNGWFSRQDNIVI